MARQLLHLILIFTLFKVINSGVLDKKFEKEFKDLLKNDNGARVEESAGLFEGDIEMDENTKRALIGGKIMSRDAIINPIYHWPDGRVHFAFHSSINHYTKHQIYRAMEHIETYTCVTFERDFWQSFENRIIFFKGKGCYSRIGRNPNGRSQKISIGRGCTRLGTIVHEITHALGFFHEHTRPDRDKFVKIMWQNIKKKHAHNFRKYPRMLGTTLGKPYDYLSVMHYSKYAFSIYGAPTIIAKKKKAIMGQRYGLSYYDAYQINKLYKCKPLCVDRKHPFLCEYYKSKGYCHRTYHGTAKYMAKVCKRTCTKCGTHIHIWE